MIVSVHTDTAFHERVAAAAAALARPHRAVVDLDELGLRLREGLAPAAVVLGDRVGMDEALRAARSLADQQVPVLLVAEPSTSTLRAALRAGARDVVSPDFTTDDLVEAVEPLLAVEDGVLDGATIAIFASKGGVGTTAIASNLAIRLGEHRRAEVGLLDLDLASADLASVHGLQPAWTLQDVASDGRLGEPGAVDDLLLRVPDTRVRLLPGPTDPALAETIPASAVTMAVTAVRSVVPYAVLDTSSAFSDVTLAALDTADAIVLPASLDIAALRGLGATLRAMGALGVTRDRIRVVITRSDAKVGLRLSDVERTLGTRVDVAVPSSKDVPASMNLGVPLAVSSARNKVVRAIDELVESLDGIGPDPVTGSSDGGSSGRLGGLLRRGGDEDPVPAAPAAGPDADRPPAPAQPRSASVDAPAPEPRRTDAARTGPTNRAPVLPGFVAARAPGEPDRDTDDTPAPAPEVQQDAPAPVVATSSLETASGRGELDADGERQRTDHRNGVALADRLIVIDDGPRGVRPTDGAPPHDAAPPDGGGTDVAPPSPPTPASPSAPVDVPEPAPRASDPDEAPTPEPPARPSLDDLPPPTLNRQPAARDDGRRRSRKHRK